MQDCTIKTRLTLLILFCWGLPFLWLATIPSPGSEYGGFTQSNDRIKTLKKVIDLFKVQNHRPPKTLRELKLFMADRNIQIAIYDGFGNRFNYIAFNNEDYLVRSFGRDGKQNTIKGARDIIATNLSNKPIKGVDVIHNPQSSMRYPIAALLGSFADDKNKHAAIIKDYFNIYSYLFVTVKQKNQAARYLIAAPSSVQEYFWVPGQNKIVMSVLEDEYYPDGIYLWDLALDELDPIFNSKSDFSGLKDHETNNYWLALGSIDTENNVLYFYRQAIKQDQLDPMDFFSTKNLVAVSLPLPDKKEYEPKLVTFTEEPLENYLGLSRENSHPKTGFANAADIHKKLLVLPLKGSIEFVLGHWTEYCSLDEVRISPVFSHCLWHLAIIYADAYSALVDSNNSENAEKLRALGVELASELAQSPNAPNYLRAQGLFLYRRLLAQDYQAINLATF
ncbi:MAG: type II secretion system protein GspG [Oligoflexales bacterium]|nr:type II secretion system protein GspG [Oligoflexales bacterium]